MRERGKGVEMYSRNNKNGSEFFQDYSIPPEAIPCKRHPFSSSVGVCAYCLKERLVGLVCSDCGEQRLSSCSCSSEMISSSSSNTNGGDVGSVGRISFLLENDHGKSKEEIMNFLLKSSSSRRVEEEIKRRRRRDGFWRIGRLFRKKRPEKGIVDCERKSTSGSSGVWFVDYISGIPRSRSLCSFRGGGGGGGVGGKGGIFESEDGSTFSGARSSVSAARSSGFNGGLLFDPDRKSGFSEPEPRRSSGFNGGLLFDPDRKSGFSEPDPRRSSGFNGGLLFDPNDHSLQGGGEALASMVDDSAFIDLKFDPDCSKLEPNSPAVKLRSLSDSNTAFGSMRSGGDDLGGGRFVLPHGGGSCRITVGERGTKRTRKSFKSWRWIFSYHIPISKKSNIDVHVGKD